MSPKIATSSQASRWPRLAGIWAALVAAIGADEALLAIALILLTVGLWSHLGPTALTVPGAALLWIALPTRAGFVARASVDDDKARRPR